MHASPLGLVSTFCEDEATLVAIHKFCNRNEGETELFDIVRQVRRYLARNPHAPASVLTELSASLDKSVRAAVAGNHSVSPSVLHEMVGKETEERVQFYLSNNPSSSSETLTLLMGSSNIEILVNIANHKNATQIMLAELYYVGHVNLQAAVLRNENAPAWIRQMSQLTGTPLKRKS